MQTAVMKAARFVVIVLLALSGITITDVLSDVKTEAQESNTCSFYPPIQGSPIPSPNAIPFEAPTQFETSNKHSGEDILAKPGTPVMTIGTGTVISMGDWPTWAAGKWENVIWVEHVCGSEKLYSQYVHLDNSSISNPLVKVGDKVEPGTVVGVVGKISESGFGNADHLHLGLTRTDPRAVNDLAALTNIGWLKPSDFIKNGPVEIKPTFVRGSTGETTVIPRADWELWYLRPEVSKPLQFISLALVIAFVPGYLLVSWARAKKAKQKPNRVKAAWRGFNKLFEAILPLLAVWTIVVWSKVELWPVKQTVVVQTQTNTPEAFSSAAKELGYDELLLYAFYLAAVPRDASGKPTSDGNGFVFPPQAAAAIPFGETNASDWGNIDPTQPGPWGRYVAWTAVETRWPVSLLESVQGKTVSGQAQKQQAGLTAIAEYLNNSTNLPTRLGRQIKPTELYGSSAGAVGRTQILPSYFAPGDLCGDSPKDPWNDPLTIADCTTRHLITRGCWGNWIVTGDVWSALCGYNPGAWDKAEHAWYWEVLGKRSSQIEQLADKYQLLQPTSQLNGQSIATVTQAITTDKAMLPTPLFLLRALNTAHAISNGAVLDQRELDSETLLANLLAKTDKEVIENLYRIVRIWTTMYFSAEELVQYGVKP